jgi:hypothetical protein
MNKHDENPTPPTKKNCYSFSHILTLSFQNGDKRVPNALEILEQVEKILGDDDDSPMEDCQCPQQTISPSSSSSSSSSSSRSPDYADQEEFRPPQ